MEPVSPAGGRRRRAANEVKAALRDLNIQLALLNRHVGLHAEVKEADLHCLDLINRHGPLSPSALARRAGLHPATVTGVLDRLEGGGWITRERDPAGPDRRAVAVRALPEGSRALFRLFSGMRERMDGVCADYTEEELRLIAGFLRRTTEAGGGAASRLADEDG